MMRGCVTGPERPRRLGLPTTRCKRRLRAAKRFVAADVGVGFIARSNVQEDVRANVLVAIPMSDAQVRRDLALVFRKDKALSRAALAFIDTTVKIKTVDAVAPAKR